MERGIQEIELPNGETVLAAVRVVAPEQLPDGRGEDPDFEFEDTGAADGLAARVERLNELVSGVGSAVLEAAREAQPDEVSATFGVEILVKPGKAVALLADGEVKGAISVTLTWKRGDPAQQQEQ
ncbi:CU044_2847 family protein [Streptomyces ovatisporus]|uniref:CU044_2847 family protein n=1 Tax=Streptomyces ovatisporus TaxID=1128682 RepID=A0ABV9A154_9ACTN